VLLGPAARRPQRFEVGADGLGAPGVAPGAIRQHAEHAIDI
jgi:hypothetical protein